MQIADKQHRQLLELGFIWNCNHYVYRASSLWEIKLYSFLSRGWEAFTYLDSVKVFIIHGQDPVALAKRATTELDSVCKLWTERPKTVSASTHCIVVKQQIDSIRKEVETISYRPITDEEAREMTFVMKEVLQLLDNIVILILGLLRKEQE